MSLNIMQFQDILTFTHSSIFLSIFTSHSELLFCGYGYRHGSKESQIWVQIQKHGFLTLVYRVCLNCKWPQTICLAASYVMFSPIDQLF